MDCAKCTVGVKAGEIMPELERGAFEGAELHRLNSETTYAREVRAVVFTTDDVLFRRFVKATYDAHVYKWEAIHPIGSFLVTLDEWTKYAFTALRSRLARVNDDRGQIRSDDEWQIPSMIASVLNSVGRVTIDGPAMKYTPVWNTAYDGEVLTRDEWARITTKLRALAADRESAKFIFVRGLSGDRSGDRMVMDLIPVRDAIGRIVALHSDVPVDGVAAFVYLACGFLPEAFEGITLDVHPRVLPRRFIPVDVLESGCDELGLRSA
jgi:hypothetical protein